MHTFDIELYKPPFYSPQHSMLFRSKAASLLAVRIHSFILNLNRIHGFDLSQWIWTAQHCTCVEVREQFARVGLTTPFWIPGTKVRLLGLCGKYIYSLSLTPSYVFHSQLLICTFLFLSLFVCFGTGDLNYKSNFDINQLHKLNPLKVLRYLMLHSSPLNFWDLWLDYTLQLSTVSITLSFNIFKQKSKIKTCFCLSGPLLSTSYALSFSLTLPR